MTGLNDHIDAAQLVDRTQETFQEIFGYDCSATAIAPGRVNLIGEHIDYNQGFVLPFGINRYTAVSIGTNAKVHSSDTDVLCRIHSVNKGDSYCFQVSAGEPPPLQGSWQSYVYGVIIEFDLENGNLSSFDAVIDSTLPIGSGLSSSAALEVALATALEAHMGSSHASLKKAKLCQRAEHVYAGVPCGIMDQYASSFSQADTLLLLDCVSLDAKEISVKDADVAFLVMDTSVRHQLADDEYSTRRDECGKALAILGASSWRDVSPELISADHGTLGATLVKRAQHIASEIVRTKNTAIAIENKRWNVAGELMFESHDSLKNDFEVSCPELDTLVNIAHELGTEAGVYGSRMTGGGFGGSTITLVKESNAKQIANAMANEYETKTGLKAQWFLTRPTKGAYAKPNDKRPSTSASSTISVAKESPDR